MSRTSDLTCWALTRTAGVDLNPALVVQRSEVFSAGTKGFDSTTLLLRREGATMRGYLLTSGAGGDSMRAATELAHAVGAKAVESSIPADLDVSMEEATVVGYLTYLDGSSVARNPQVNADPTGTAQLLANRLADGCWIAVSLRRPSAKEKKRHTAWLSHRLSTAVPNHHSMSPDALVVSFYAGGPDPVTVESMLEATRSAMPGFDVETRTVIATRASTIKPWVLASLAAVVAGVGSVFAPTPSLLVPGLVLGLLALLIGAGRFLGLLPSAWRRTIAMASSSSFDPPAKRRGRPAPPRKEVTTASKTQKEREGDYPLHRATFLVGPQVVIGVVAPHAGAESGEASTKVRPVPPIMLQRIGPLIGDTDKGPAYLSALDTSGGVAIVGKAGSGKSVLTRSLFAWSCLERVAPSRLPGFPGAHNAIIAFENKGGGVAAYQEWADTLGDIMVVIDLADPESWGIDLFAIPGTVFERANFFVNALKYAFGEGAIQDRSFETLLSVIPAALMVTPQMASAVPGLSANGSALYYTHTLLGGRGDEAAGALVHELHAAAARRGADPVLAEVITHMGHLYGEKVTPAQRRGLLEAPRNKMRQLIELESWWTPSRRKVTWNQIIEDHRIVVINTGPSGDGKMVEEELSGQMSSLLMYSLRHAIQRLCADWQDVGRSVSIFADELSLLAGSSETVVTWLKDQGRSFGVRPYLATQRPEQLSPRVRSNFMNFSTLISYTQEDSATAREIAEGVSSGVEGEWTAADVLNLDTYTAIVRAHVDKKRQPAFTVRVRNFEADRSTFASQQGHPTPGTNAPAPASFDLGPRPPQPPFTTLTPPAAPLDEPGDDDVADVPDLMSW